MPSGGGAAVRCVCGRRSARAGGGFRSRTVDLEARMCAMAVRSPSLAFIECAKHGSVRLARWIRSAGCDVMADKRLWWVPTDINQWRGNPRIQALSDAAYRGYHNLLMTEWQTDDCTLPTEDAELAVLSTLRSRWNKNAPAIRAMFVTVTVTVSGTDTERLRDAAQYEEWLRAKRVHDKQSLSAHRTNEKRSARRSPSAVSATATAPVTESQTETVTAPVNPSVSSHSFPSDSIADRCTITANRNSNRDRYRGRQQKSKSRSRSKNLG